MKPLPRFSLLHIFIFLCSVIAQAQDQPKKSCITLNMKSGEQITETFVHAGDDSFLISTDQGRLETIKKDDIASFTLKPLNEGVYCKSLRLTPTPVATPSPQPSLAAVARAKAPALSSTLSNKDVLDMLSMGLSTEVVLAKIKASTCNFDTSLAALQELKTANVPEPIIVAMVEAPSGKASSEASIATKPTPNPRPVRSISEGMPEYGNISEIKDMYRAYVLADDPDSISLLVGTLKKYKGIEIVASPDDAEFFITYVVKASTEALGRQPSHYLRSQLLVSIPSESGRNRIVWFENETYEETRGLSFSRPNEMNLALHLIKALKKLRGEK